MPLMVFRVESVYFITYCHSLLDISLQIYFNVCISCFSSFSVIRLHILHDFQGQLLALLCLVVLLHGNCIIVLIFRLLAKLMNE